MSKRGIQNIQRHVRMTPTFTSRFNETMTHVAGVLHPHGLGLGVSINSDCNAANTSAGGGFMAGLLTQGVPRSHRTH